MSRTDEEKDHLAIQPKPILDFDAKGGFGSVFKAKHKVDQSYYALKVISSFKSLRQLKLAQTEAKLLSSLNHPNIVRYYFSWIDFSPKDCNNLHSSSMLTAHSTGHYGANDSKQIVSTLFIQMEYCHTTLSKWINERNIVYRQYQEQMKCFDTSVDPSDFTHLYQRRPVRLITDQLIVAVNYLHKNGIIHRDLKPSNIFIKKMKPEHQCDCKKHPSMTCYHWLLLKVGDFGLATLIEDNTPASDPTENGNNSFKDDSLTGNIGSAIYVAPEVMQAGEDKKCHYDFMADMYSIGVILLEIFYPITTQSELIHIISNMVEVPVPNVESFSLEDADCIDYLKRIRAFIPEVLAKEWPFEEDLLVRLLCKSPSFRLTSKELLESIAIFQSEVIITEKHLENKGESTPLKEAMKHKSIAAEISLYKKMDALVEQNAKLQFENKRLRSELMNFKSKDF